MKSRSILLAFTLILSLLVVGFTVALSQILNQDMNDGTHFLQDPRFSSLKGEYMIATGYANYPNSGLAFGPLTYDEQVQMWQPGLTSYGSARSLPVNRVRYTVVFTDLTDLYFPRVTITSALPLQTLYIPNSATASTDTLTGTNPVVWQNRVIAGQVVTVSALARTNWLPWANVPTTQAVTLRGLGVTLNRVLTTTITPLAWSSDEVGPAAALAWGDYDRDGDLDLAVGYKSAQRNQIYLNENGVLVPVQTLILWDTTFNLAWGDYDNDNDLDLAVGNDGRNHLYRNDDGMLTFDQEVDALEEETRAVAWGDWDNDGDLDLALGNADGPVRIYENDPLGAFSLVWSSAESDDTRALVWADCGGDGLLDLAVGNVGLNRLYLCAGLSGYCALDWSSFENEPTTGLDWGDWDGDGDWDLAVGNAGSPNRVYVYDGSTLTTAGGWTATLAYSTTAIAWVNADADAYLDLSVTNSAGEPNQLYLNTGDTLALHWETMEADDSLSLARGDVDGDGDSELTIANEGQPLRQYRHDGNVLPAYASFSLPTNENARDVAWGDYNNDGLPDLAVASSARANVVYRNTGIGFTPVYTTTEEDASVSIVWGDYDGDNDLDLAVANTNSQLNRLYRNNGDDTFSLVWSSPQVANSQDVAWGDPDADGDLDLAVANDGPNRLYCNDGGVLVLCWSSGEAADSRTVAWGDYDGDGLPDLAFGNDGENHLYHNGGGTAFALVWSSPEGDDTHAVAWADYDANGLVDLAAGNTGVNRLYANAGGTLDLAWSSLEADDTRALAWAETNGDGRPDLLAGNAGQPNRLYRSDGGTLTLAWVSDSAFDTRAVALTDLDQDGDPDLVAVDYDQPAQVYLNSRITPPYWPSNPTYAVLETPGDTGVAPLYGSAQVFDSAFITLTYHLCDPESDPVPLIRPWYSLDGGGEWLIPTIDGGDGLSDLTSAPSPTCAEHALVWDVEADRISSDDVLFRVEIVYQLPRRVGLIQFALQGAQTTPFRVQAVPDLSFSTKSVSANQTLPGERLDYQLAVRNIGMGTSVLVTDTLPDELTWAGGLTATKGVPGFDGARVLWSDTLTRGEVVTISYAVTVNECLVSDTAITNLAELKDGTGMTITRLATTTVTNAAPEAPGNPSPPDGATGQALDTVLAWSASLDLNCDPITYAVAFGDSDPPPVVVLTTLPNYTPTLISGTTYYWAITATDGTSATMSSVWSFTTTAVVTPNRSPFEPFSPDPEDGAMDVSIDKTLGWQGGDPDGDLVTYTLAFGSSDPPPIVASSLTITGYDPGTLITDTVYYWVITATDGMSTVVGPTWSFSTVTPPPTCAEIVSVALTVVTTGTLYQDMPVRFEADITPDGASLPYYYFTTIDGVQGSVMTTTIQALTFTAVFSVAGPHIVEIATWNCNILPEEAVTDTMGVNVVEPGYTIYLPVVLKGD